MIKESRKQRVTLEEKGEKDEGGKKGQRRKKEETGR